VHLRVAPSDGGPRLIASRPSRRFHPTCSILLVAATAALAAACHNRPAPPHGLQFEWTLAPAPAAVGPATVELRVKDAVDHPVAGAALHLEAQMSHPGMAAESMAFTERGNGRYDVVVRFTMSGDWILLVRGSLPDGTPVEHRIDVPHVRPS
jgi:hypothetical protein